jgi:macrolide transport system ATP-binding/permease protein
VTLIRAHEVTAAGRLPSPITVALESGSRLVVGGPNGAGKSTLLGILAGTLAPTSGEVRRAPNARVELLHQESRQPSGRSPRELYAACVARLVQAGALGEGEAVPLKTLGLLGSQDANRPVGDLSMGQQRRLDLALALASRPHVLLLDEPTNHLSIALVDELTEALQAAAAAVVIATHDRQLRQDAEHWPRPPLGAASASVSGRG